MCPTKDSVVLFHIKMESGIGGMLDPLGTGVILVALPSVNLSTYFKFHIREA